MRHLGGYTPGAGGRATMSAQASALSSLPLCEEQTDRRTCLEPMQHVEGTIYRVRCRAGHERQAKRGEPEAIDGAMAAFWRRGGR